MGIGAAGGASAAQLARPVIEMAPTAPTRVASLVEGADLVAVKGRVAEIYGDKAVIDDGTGRVLVGLGPDNIGVVTKDSTIRVQGRFDNGELHSSYLTLSDGKVLAVGPHGPRGPHAPPPPHHGPGDPERGAPPPCLVAPASTSPSPPAIQDKEAR
ncbi:hypothetical protein [Sphingopyxis sp. KK2]|uniref:hypothetical protein n=1 Tax=Sphingopyxis sp. KK2 TaxID=1855727 RepID=UPI0009F885D4|nr:hypothetical protein [Sphingopyxis sp. KK2]